MAILALGGVGAMPFLRPTTKAPALPTRETGKDLALRGVPLQVSAAPSRSPAVGLYDQESPEAARPASVERGPADLDQVGAPPEFNSSYPTLLEPVEAWTNRPESRDIGPRPVSIERDVRKHRIIDGDTLGRLARKYLGDASRAGEIYAANRDLLATPDILPLGVEIAIPAR